MVTILISPSFRCLAPINGWVGWGGGGGWGGVGGGGERLLEGGSYFNVDPH